MFVTRNVYLRYRLSRPADEGDDLAGDFGNDFTPTTEGPAGTDGANTSGAGAGDGEPLNKEGDEGEDGKGEGGEDDLRSAADDSAAGDDKEAKDTGTPKVSKGKHIPLDRHEKLLKKERDRREQLESELAQSRAGQQMAKANDEMAAIEDELVAMEKRYNDLLAEGDTEGAASQMTAIRRKNAELNQVAGAQREAQVLAQAVEQVRYEETVDRIEAEYPELVRGSDEFDEDKYQDVIDLLQAGQRRGLSASKALQRAVERVMGASTAAQKRATTVTPRVDEKDVAAQRRTEAVKRNLGVAGKQPPATHRAGESGPTNALTLDAVMKMSEEEFDKLSEKDLAVLRGDKM